MGADDPTLGEVIRTSAREHEHTRAALGELAAELRAAIRALVRADVHAVEHAALTARIGAEETARVELEREVRAAADLAVRVRRERLYYVWVPVVCSALAAALAVLALVRR